MPQRRRHLRRIEKKDLFALPGVVSVLILTFLTTDNSVLPGEIKYNWPLAVFAIIAFIALILVWITPRENLQAIFANTFGWLPAVVAAISWPYWSWWGTWNPPVLANADFYAAAAAVLPVLLLAAVVDVRRSATLKTHQLLLPIIVVFLGEIDALGVLAFPQTNATDEFASVAASLTGTIIALLLAVLADIATPEENKRGAVLPAEESRTIAAAQTADTSDDNRHGSATEP